MDSFDKIELEPDCNPDEIVLDYPQRRINEQQPTVNSLFQLLASQIAKWARMPVIFQRKLAEFMPSKCNTVIQAHYGHTHY